ncbi:hypothetical protein [Desertibacillus haloalkaliphilus]|uniref:hypothetical protein n=1 Tax=Desertibacillus haloalkaliphilus TaxID=1328930 RepID=UPI001C2642C6|nr:hypothetical protein [Desertibacillus haloalkaliphilus]MBU8908075.1 hypothetical protein [Desertibacillus haloalkaliphilus]
MQLASTLEPILNNNINNFISSMDHTEQTTTTKLNFKMDIPSEAFKDLCIAALLGQGDILTNSNQRSYIYVSFAEEKYAYIKEYLDTYQLNNYIELTSNDFKTVEFDFLKHYKDLWYINDMKIFHMDAKHMNLSLVSIIMWINLFGKTQVEGTSITTNINDQYIRNLCFYLERLLQIPAIPKKNKVKLFHLYLAYEKVINHTNLIHTTQYINYLSQHEVTTIKNRPYTS